MHSSKYDKLSKLIAIYDNLYRHGNYQELIN